MKIRIEGKAVPKARPRVTSKGWAYTPKKTQEYEEKVREAWRSQSGESYPEYIGISIAIKVHVKIPKSKPKYVHKEMIEKYHIHKPDLDNLVKSITDALNGYAYHDDSQICSVFATKVWGEKDYVDVVIGSVIGGAI